MQQGNTDADGTATHVRGNHDENMFFGAAFNAEQREGNGAASLNSDDDSSISISSGDTKDEGDEEDSINISESSADLACSSVDSLDIVSLSLSIPYSTPVTDKKNPPSAKKKDNVPAVRIKSTYPDCIRLNSDLTDLDRDVYAPKVFFDKNRRKVAVLTMWLPGHYNQSDVSALVNDGGNTLTVKLRPPRQFLSPIILAATNIAGYTESGLGLAYGNLCDDLPSSNFEKKMVFDLPFQAEVNLCPEAFGKAINDSGAEVVDIELDAERGVGRQLILAVRETLPEDMKQENVGRRIFR
jgi:hypothetical protein